MIAWLERRGNKLKSLHILRRNEQGGVTYEVLPGGDSQYLQPPRMVVTVERFEAYLRGVLARFGGDAKAYEALGVARPQVEPVITADVSEQLDHAYTRAAHLLKVAEEDLREKYGKLNPGMQAMQLKNALKRGGYNT